MHEAIKLLTRNGIGRYAGSEYLDGVAGPALAGKIAPCHVGCLSIGQELGYAPPSSSVPSSVAAVKRSFEKLLCERRRPGTAHLVDRETYDSR